MILLIRNYIIILIALLQLVAPLVHAHSSSKQNTTLGIHLPGLESLSQHQQLPGIHADASHLDCCGILIAVSCGMQQAKNAADLPALPALCSDRQAAVPGNTDFVTAAINFSPQPDPFYTQTAVLPISPRAPPFFALAI